MAKLLGYIIALAGLSVLAASFFSSSLPLPSQITPKYLMIGGLAIIIIGIAISMWNSSSRSKQSAEEVPIYAGTGKHRKIVGYRREK